MKSENNLFVHSGCEQIERRKCCEILAVKEAHKIGFNQGRYYHHGLNFNQG